MTFFTYISTLIRYSMNWREVVVKKIFSHDGFSRVMRWQHPSIAF